MGHVDFEERPDGVRSVSIHRQADFRSERRESASRAFIQALATPVNLAYMHSL